MKRNIFTFGFGTIGRDMLYSLVSMYLIVYLTEVLTLSNATMWWITFIIVGARVFDAVNDPIMGTIVDNTKSRWGKFKPWIAFGALTSGLFTILLFTDFGLTNGAFIALFALVYVGWGVAFTTNDISYWAMLPSLSVSQRDRGKMMGVARIFANIGLFSVVVGIVPITKALEATTGSMTQAYFIFTIAIVAIMWVGQSVTLFGVKEPKGLFVEQEKTTLSGLLHTLRNNDQLLALAIAMSVFMIGYVTTTSFGLYYFIYAFEDEGMYSIFALVLGVSQLGTLALFPLISKRFTRGQLFTFGTIFVFIGYIIFYFAPMNMLVIGPAGLFLFIGQALIQVLMYLFLADCIEYGQWKLGRRNEGITFSVQPFINKIGGAIATGIVGAVAIISGINDADGDPSLLPAGGVELLKASMLILPLLLIIASYIIYRKLFKIDEKFYATMIKDLKDRGELNLSDDDAERVIEDKFI
ncbi:glycoside-pentoside-hexuronide (GPH):cation symporter [Xianfuyuplasma coldseepsis]|uniref:Sugar transporter n=1 Tax=Candidatus Xianfuyuplasma coldseepsis TaxID=2782163 RepID=A0A7L7KUB6_9MOLU|nr:sugar transporter [Xianfuyuplasma coldseepsis]